jgi:L-lactate dehydrogenase complex protein LldF
MTVRVGHAAEAAQFPILANQLVDDSLLRKNVRHATDVIQNKRAHVVAEQHDWQQLRFSASKIKEHTLKYLDRYLEQFEAACTRAGGHVHWAADADEANRIIVDLMQSAIEKNGWSREVIKVKTMTSDEINLNAALEAVGIEPHETDLADMIIQLGDDKPSHIVVPALHKNRTQVREIFAHKMNLPELGDKPQDLTDAARHYLREKFLRVKVGFSGANFLVAETGSVCVVESEGNGRMCLTLPELLITVAGIEKIIPAQQDLEVFLQLLPRSATGERMNPYNTLWTGVHVGDGPREFHIVLLDNGRTNILADKESRQTLHCIRCGACLNACPVYSRTGGHAYGSIYAGPIGAILTPQLQSMKHSQSLPFASSLCGACYEVCPVRINIPDVLLHLRSKVVQRQQDSLSSGVSMEGVAMKAAAFIFARPVLYRLGQKFAVVAQRVLVRKGWIHWLPGMLGGWTEVRDLKALPQEPFREWWAKREAQQAKEQPHA